MKQELFVASEWWAKQLVEQVGEKASSQLKQELYNELFQRVKNHWYIEDPERGSGYRAIIVDEHQQDLVLVKCANRIGVGSKVKFPEAIMFLNPGEVKIRSKYGDKHLYVNSK